MQTVPTPHTSRLTVCPDLRDVKLLRDDTLRPVVGRANDACDAPVRGRVGDKMADADERNRRRASGPVTLYAASSDLRPGTRLWCEALLGGAAMAKLASVRCACCVLQWNAVWHCNCKGGGLNASALCNINRRCNLID